MNRYLIVIVIIAVLVTVTTSSCHGHVSTIQKTILPVVTPASSTSPIIVSIDIGAQFPQDQVQLKYVSFIPVITKSEAIAIAKKKLHDGFGWDTDNLAADATVALFSGNALPTSTRSGGIVNDVQSWIIVVKDIPFIGSVGPPPLTPNTSTFRAQPSWQLNLAIDSTTGEDIDSVITSMLVQ